MLVNNMNSFMTNISDITSSATSAGTLSQNYSLNGCLENNTQTSTRCALSVSISSTFSQPSNATMTYLINSTLQAPSSISLISELKTVILGILAAVVSVVTVLGNLTVLLAFGLERTIRQPTNYFIASLAVSDLLIGTFSMPLFTQYLLLTYWPLGPWLCDLWLSLDWTVCLTSQYTVFSITMDRFLSVKIPAKYRNWRTKKKVLVMVAITWVVPTLVFFTSVIGWQYFVGQRTVKPLSCEVQFMSDPLFTFILTIGYYWVTLIVMCVLYSSIYKVALNLQHKSDAKQRKLEATLENANHSNLALPHSHVNSKLSNAHFFTRKRAREKCYKSAIRGTNSSHDSSNLAKIVSKIKTVSSAGKARRNTESCDGHGNIDIAIMEDADNREDDRSSSPAFASDDEDSISGQNSGKASKKRPSVNHGKQRGTRTMLNQKSAIAGIVNTAMLTTPVSIRATIQIDCSMPSLIAVSSPVKNKPIQPLSIQSEMSKCLDVALYTGPITHPFHSALIADIKMNDDEDDDISPSPLGHSLLAGHCRHNYDRISVHAESDEECETGTISQFANNKVLVNCPYIDQTSLLMAVQSNADVKAAIGSQYVASRDLSLIEKQATAPETESPLWKRRQSLPPPPIASDIFDIALDEDFTDGLTTEFTTLSSVPYCPVMLSDVNEMEPAANNTFLESDNCYPSSVSLSPMIPKLQNVLTDQQQSNEKEMKQHASSVYIDQRNSRRKNRCDRKSKSENRARKALRTITIILGAFVICWTPYHIMLFVIAMCTGGYECINFPFYNFTYWLCYLNSPINPFCYALANAQFKRTFIRILRFDWHRT